jgi:hypothetical protein
MEPAISIIEHAEFLQRLGPPVPASLTRFDGADTAGPAQSLVLRFTYRDVPFVARVERRDGVAMLCRPGAAELAGLDAAGDHRRRHDRA